MKSLSILSDTLITDRFKRKLELLVFYVICAECIERADVKQLYPTAAYQCLRNTGLKYTIIRCLKPNGTLQTDVVNNLINARAVSMATDITFCLADANRQ